MTITHVDTSSLEHLDFEYEPPCEHTQHRTEHPAIYVVARLIPCHSTGTYLCCLACWERMGWVRNGLTCVTCNAVIGFRDEILKIVHVIGT